MSEFHNYTDWLASSERTNHRNWAVTYRQTGEPSRCEVLQWENSNAKWYRLEPYEGREEAGCYFDIWTKDPTRNARILSVRSV